MSCWIIVQARMTSTRLPGKVLRPVLGQPLLGYELERLKRCQNADGILVATTINATDDPVVHFCQTQDIPVFRGNEQDVLSRYFGAAQQVQASTIVRVTADCPVIDPEIVDQVIARFQTHAAPYDYISNTLTRSFPRGLDAEVFSFNALSQAHYEATEPAHREHVTPFLYTQPERFRLGAVEATPSTAHHRWTVDTPEDFELIRHIIESLYPTHPQFSYQDILALLAKHPDWVGLNAHIEQVKVG
jgi:spore coat polysaccharide biosynthesis protein SpsF